MRATHLSLLSVAVVLNWGLMASAQEKYDLSGAVPAAGTEINSLSTLLVKDAEFKVKTEDSDLPGKLSVSTQLKMTSTLEAADDKRVTKVVTKVFQALNSHQMTILRQTQQQATPEPISGKTIISEFNKGKWTSQFKDIPASPATEAALKSFLPRTGRNSVYPKEEVPVGHRWTVDASEWGKNNGRGEFRGTKGKVKCLFKEVKENQGEQIAVIETEIDISGPLQILGGEMDIELKGTGTTYHSLKTGLDQAKKVTGTLKMSGKINPGGGSEATFTMNGNVVLTEQCAVK